MMLLPLSMMAQEKLNNFEISKSLDIYNNVLKILNLNYVDDINPSELNEAAINAMLESLDPYTVYIPESEIEDVRLMTTGEYGGIGAIISYYDNAVHIAEPYENSPAHKSGLLPGDILLEINGMDVSKKNTSEVSELLKGQPGTTVTLKIKRYDESIATKTLTRENIKVHNITYQREYHDAIGYISLIPEQNNKRYYELKARFYAKLGDYFLEDEDFANSIKVFKMALKYAKNTDPKLESKVKGGYANAYNEYAEKFINENDPNHAILMLENALEIFPDPHAMYKLGLIYQNVDDDRALRYIEDAYNIKPEIVNVEIYNNLLNKLMKRAKEEGEYSKSRFYSLKLDNFKRKIINNNIFKGDLEISNFQIFSSRKYIIGEKQYFVSFDIKNGTKYPVDNLFIKLLINPQGGKIVETELKVINRNKPLEPNKTVKNVRIPIIAPPYDLFASHAEIQILARKNIRSQWTMIEYITASFTK